MGLADQVIAAVVLAGALYLLYRSLWKKPGGCHGCASGGCRAAPRQAPDLVHLGEVKRRGTGAGGP